MRYWRILRVGVMITTMIATTSPPAASAFWQPALSTRAGDRWGQVVTGADDIDQCIHIILTTPRDSDPLRPRFGSNLHMYLDYPVDSARPHLVREVVDALRQWEPRIRVIKVQVQVLLPAQLQISVIWRFDQVDDSSAQVTNLALRAL